MVPSRYRLGVFVLIISLVSLADGIAPPKSKRQIYREQVLPSKGGKIPDAAFRTDRLALNRLNKEGIAIPDGVLLEHRQVHSHPHTNQHDPEDEDSLIKIIQRPEDRYVAPAGKYDNKKPLTVSSTYIIRKPIGPENIVIRTPLEQSGFHDQNQIYRYYPESYYQQSYSQNYVPSQVSPKYSPVRLKAHVQNYLPKEITTPPQKYLPGKFPTPPSKYLSAELSAPPVDFSGTQTNIIRHPHPNGYSAPVSYQQIHQSIAYYPISVPLEIPNKNSLNDEYYTIKSQENTYGGYSDSEDIHSMIDWPYLLKQYTRLTDKINILNHNSYGQPIPHSLFFTPEVLSSVDSGSRYYATRDRYARKSKEIAFTDSSSEPSGKSGLKNKVSSTNRKLIKLKCTSRVENTVEGGSSQCFIRY